MEDVTEESDSARRTLARHITVALRAALIDHPRPELLLHETPSVLAIMAGSHLLQLTRSQVLGDGEVDKVLAGMVRDMQAAADPSRNAPTGREMSTSWGRRFRALIKGKAGR